MCVHIHVEAREQPECGSLRALHPVFETGSLISLKPTHLAGPMPENSMDPLYLCSSVLTL